MAKIIFSDSGEGDPVIFLHGFCESKEVWAAFQERLSKNYRTIAPDIPGFGDSPAGNASILMGEAADELHDWLQGLDVNSSVLIGHSMGGYLALAYAKKYPEKVRALGLFHSTVFEDTEEKKAMRGKTIEFIRKNGMTPFLENFVPGLFYKENRERLADTIRRQVEAGKKIAGDSAIAWLAAMRDRPDSADFIRQFDKPVMMIIGENDEAVPYDKSMEQARLLKHPTVHVLDKTGHMGMFERERETLDYVEGFVNALN